MYKFIDIKMLFMLQVLLHYHINNSNTLLSEIFGNMKETKKRYFVIEDFTVGDTTLEQVFIAFAKEQAALYTGIRLCLYHFCII